MTETSFDSSICSTLQQQALQLDCECIDDLEAVCMSGVEQHWPVC
jgi:hypothetical protein